MKTKFARQLEINGWPLAAAAVYCALIGAVALASQTLPSSPRLCLFHLITGHPCPTCGATRCWLALAHGEWVNAWRYNPLWFALTLAMGPLLVAWVQRRRRGEQLLPQRAVWRWTLGAVLAVLFFTNWAYLWIAGR